MTHRTIYASIFDGTFGAGSATFDVADTLTNEVIGALARQNNFDAFKANFGRRLCRPSAAIQADPSLRQDVLVAVNNIATTEWAGAYAELSALDYFLADASTGPGAIVLNRTVLASDTLASEMGNQNANHDMNFPGLGVSMDTKLLSDKAGGIVEGILNDFRKSKGIAHLTICLKC